MIKIGVTGYTGRVGKLLIQELQSGQYKKLKLAGGSSRSLQDKSPDFFVTTDAQKLFAQSDVIIDFTVPKSTMEHIQIAQETNTPIVIGTTGMTAEQDSAIAKATKNTPIVYAANTSIGITLLCALVEQAAAKLTENWDIEIFEAHHKHKVDSPSGTALALGKAAAVGREVELNDVAEYSREGITGARKNGKIGFSVARGGDVVGEHDVTFYTEGERLTLAHKATNRALFAKGALRAAEWVRDQKNGLYSMKNVLAL